VTGMTCGHCAAAVTEELTALPGVSEVSVDLTAPGAPWNANYRASAQNSSLPPALHELDDALAAVRTFLAPLLTDSITAGQWNPFDQA